MGVPIGQDVDEHVHGLPRCPGLGCGDSVGRGNPGVKRIC